jgi:hypothetical protein
MARFKDQHVPFFVRSGDQAANNYNRKSVDAEPCKVNALFAFF